jgi:uncharacterized RDD family membrane protein YckC
VPPALPVELASFGQRAVGFVVDSVLVLVGGSVVAPGGHGDVGVLVVVCLLQWMQSATGATVGKLFVGVRLVRAGSHARVGFGRCLLRWVAHWLDAVPLGAGFLAPLVTRRRQTFADMIVQTIVVRRQS